MRMRELDFPAKLWAVPAERMKTEDDAEGTSFEVPLSGPAVEMALAHKVGDEVEQAYRRGTALKKRRQLMEARARYVEGTSNVVAITRSA